MTPEEIAKLQADLAAAKVAEMTAKAALTLSEAEKSTFAAKDKARDEADQKTKVEMSRKSVNDLFEEAVKAKKISPAQRDLFSRMLKVDDDGAVVNIKPEDIKALVGDGKMQDFSKDTASNNGGTDDNENSEDAGQTISDKAHEYMDNNPNVSFERATIAVMSRNRKLAEEYKNSNDNREDAA